MSGFRRGTMPESIRQDALRLTFEKVQLFYERLLATFMPISSGRFSNIEYSLIRRLLQGVDQRATSARYPGRLQSIRYASSQNANPLEQTARSY